MTGEPWDFYWNRFPDAPFALRIRVASGYLHPECDEPELLQRRARRDDPADAEMRAFKAELREAIQEPGRVPRQELSENVQYEDGSCEAFLQRLWKDLYGDEPAGAA